MAKYRPIIVCGPGSCGSSFIAKQLKERGVFMFRRTNSNYFEDSEFVDLAESRWNGGDHRDWRAGVRRLRFVRERMNCAWGWKDPRTAEIIDDVLDEFPEAVYVRIKRPRESLVASLMSRYGPPERWRRGAEQLAEWAVELAERRESRLDHFLELAPVRKLDIYFGQIEDGSWVGEVDQAIALSCESVVRRTVAV